MMRIDLIAVGKLKEPFWRDAAGEYLRRLGPLAKIRMIEVPDEPLPVRPGGPGEAEALAKEGSAILSSLTPAGFVVVLDRNGSPLSSTGLAEHLNRWMVQGRSHIAFIIGGGAGLAPEIIQRADFLLSFSSMTFPHPLMRVICLEQLYRAYKILRNEPYHR